MNTEDLHRTLEQLHSELACTERVDPESQRLLIELLGDISKLLTRSEVPEEETPGLIDRLADLSKDFGDQHPGLVTAIGRLADALSRSGV